MYKVRVFLSASKLSFALLWIVSLLGIEKLGYMLYRFPIIFTICINMTTMYVIYYFIKIVSNYIRLILTIIFIIRNDNHHIHCCIICIYQKIVKSIPKIGRKLNKVIIILSWIYFEGWSPPTLFMLYYYFRGCRRTITIIIIWLMV